MNSSRHNGKTLLHPNEEEAMSRDPIDRYQPPAYDPDDGRDVGTGSDFGADLWALYKAGRLHFPELAAFYSGVTTSTHDVKQRVDFLRASTGGEYALTLVDNLRDLLQVELRQTTLALIDTGEALVQIADDYAATDEEASARFRSLVNDVDNTIALPAVPPPPGPHAPFDSPHDPPPVNDNAPAPLPDRPPVPWLDDELDDLAPEEPTDEHTPTHDEVYPDVPDWVKDSFGAPSDERPEPQPEPDVPEHLFPYGVPDELDDGENELDLEDITPQDETPERNQFGGYAR